MKCPTFRVDTPSITIMALFVPDDGWSVHSKRLTFHKLSHSFFPERFATIMTNCGSLHTQAYNLLLVVTTTALVS
jgi:hypothetical protein